MRVVITGEPRTEATTSRWTVELAVPVDRAVVDILVQCDRPTTDAVRKYTYSGRSFEVPGTTSSGTLQRSHWRHQ